MSQETPYLKIAERSDTIAFLELVEELYDNTVYSTISPFDRERIEKMFVDSLGEDKEDICVLLLKSGERSIGTIAMSKTALLASAEDKIAVELAFWIKPAERNQKTIKLLIQAYKYWAKLVGCKAIFIGKLKGRKSPEFYSVRKL